MNRSAALTGFLAVVAIVFGAGYLSLPAIAEWAALRALSEAGFPGASLRVRHLGLTRAEIVEIDLGVDTGVSVEGVVVDYSPGRLADGVIDGIALSSPALPLRLDVGGLDLGVLGRLTEGGGDAPPAIRILGPVKVDNGRLRIGTPMGEVAAHMDGSVVFTDGLGTRADIALALDHPAARLHGRLTGIVDAQDRLQLDIRVADAASEAALGFDAMSGHVRAEGRLPDAIDGTASLTLEAVRFKGTALGNVDLFATLKKDGAADGEILIGGGNTGLTAHLSGHLDDAFDPLATAEIAADVATDGLRGPFALPDGMDAVGALSLTLAGARSDLQSLSAALQTGTLRAPGPVAGTVVFDHLGFEVPALPLDGIVSGGADIQVGPDGWRFSPADGLDVDVGAPVAGAWHRVRARLAASPDAPMLSGGPAPTDVLRLGFRLDGAVDGDQPLAGAVRGTLWPGGNDGIVVEDLTLTLDPWQLRLADLDLAADRSVLSLSGTPDDLALEVAAETRFNGALADGVRVAGGQTEVTADVRFEPGGFRVVLPGCIGVRATRLDVAGAAVRPGPLKLCPSADGRPFLHAVGGDAGLSRVDAAASLGSAEISASGAGPYPLTGMLPRLDADASYDVARGTWWGKARALGGDVLVDGLDIAAGGLDADISLEGRERLLGARIDLKTLKVSDRRRPERVQPVTVNGKGGLTTGAWGFTGAANIQSGPVLGLEARHSTADGKGRLAVTLPAWTMFPGGPQPQSAVPLLKGHVTDVGGLIEGNATFSWSPKAISSNGRVRVEGLGFGTDLAEYGGIDGTVVLSDLIEPRTEGEQRATIGLLDAGLPLKDGEARFNLPGDGTLRIDTLSWPVAGGRLGIAGVVVPFDRLPETVAAEIDGVDAADLARLADIEDLSAEGTLSGRIPVRLTDDGPVIDGASIRAVAGGVLRYTSAAAVETLRQSGQSAELLADALKDFRFTDLEVTLNGPLSGDITAAVAIKGANPALYDGKRIELNVKLQGALRELLQSASVINDIPAQIRDRVQGPAGNQ